MPDDCMDSCQLSNVVSMLANTALQAMKLAVKVARKNALGLRCHDTWVLHLQFTCNQTASSMADANGKIKLAPRARPYAQKGMVMLTIAWTPARYEQCVQNLPTAANLLPHLTMNTLLTQDLCFEGVEC